ncbi:gp53-like domain-containing protein [Mediterraneibacter hominis]
MFNTELNSNLIDYIVQNGTYYRRWHSGIQECWGNITFAATVKTSQLATITFPISFKDTNFYIQLTLSNNGTVATNIMEADSGGNTKRTTTSTITRVDKTSGNYSIRANYYVIGRWM